MTETARRLARLHAPVARSHALAAGLFALGGGLAAAALGVVLAPNVWGVVIAWIAILGVAARGARAIWRSRRISDLPGIGALVESTAGARSGSVTTLVAPTAPGMSESLLAVADARAAAIVDGARAAVRRTLGGRTRRRITGGLVASVCGAGFFLAAAPASGRADAFWHPFRTLAEARAPVLLTVDRARARRGERAVATVAVAGALRATLWTRAPGESWIPVPVRLDSAGRGQRILGPLDGDLYLRATSGSRASDVRHIAVAPAAFVATLDITAHYPAYLHRGDETLALGADTALIPEGTVLTTAGEASVALASARWSDGRGSVGLRVVGARFSGRFEPMASGVWHLTAVPADSAPLEGDVPTLALHVVADSAPVVTLAVPAGDTTLPASLRQPLVIDARDDHGLARLVVESWRASQTGKIGDTLRTPVPLGDAGDRAILQSDLDASQRGLIPGDTIHLRVVAWDNAPVPHTGSSADIALRLPTLDELRAATRDATRSLSAETDSVAGAARELGDKTADLAAERTRASAVGKAGTGAGQNSTPPGTMPFESTERAAEVARQQAALQERVRDLSHAVEDLARAAHAAGIDDSAFQSRLADVQRLLQRAITPELEQRLRELQDALQRLDPEATRQALQKLADAQEQMKEALQRTEQLFHRAAVEGQLTTLSADAEELRRQQAGWNQREAARADSAAGAHERAIATRADSLAAGLAQATRDLQGPPTALQNPATSLQHARGAMSDAAAAAEQHDPSTARRQGEQAEQALADLPKELRARRDSLSGAWRQETLTALDRAMSETADLAKRQERVAEQLGQGQSGAGTRAAQASIEEGAEAVAQQIREAAGKNALVSPGLDAALALARRQMAAARQELEQPRPSAEAAAAQAAEAVDALNATALGLAQSRADVNGSASGTGLAEALAQLAKLASQQQGMNGEAQGLLPMLGAGGDGVSQQLRALAARQRALADQLDRLQAAGATPGAGALSDEAKELARRIEAGRLDQATLQRQQQLYRRLLDAGRSLTGPEPDDQRQRVARVGHGR